MSRKTNPRRRPATMADVERAKQEAQAEAISYAMTIFFTVLCDKHAATDAELKQFWDIRCAQSAGLKFKEAQHD